MHPKHHGDGPAGLRVDTTVTDDGQAHFALHAIDEDGGERRTATWTAPTGPLGDDGRPEVEIRRSPTGRNVAVRLDGRTWTFDTASGRIVHDDPGDGDRMWTTEAGVDTGHQGSPILVWDSDDVAATRTTSHARTLRATLAPEVEITVRGPVDDAPGEAVSSTGNLMAVVPAPATEASAQALMARLADDLLQRTAAVQLRVDPAITVTIAGRRTAVQSDSGTMRDGLDRALWPPLVGPRGVLLRRARVRVTDNGPAHTALRPTSAPYSTFRGPTIDTEVLEPWLVTPDGTLLTLPFELGNEPLTTLPDGRFLLPCWAPMWWDGGNEPLSALADDGTTEQLRWNDQPLTPISAIRAVAPELVPAEDPQDDFDDDFDGWRVVGARALGDGLLLALEPEDPGPGSPWLLVELPLTGTTCGVPRLIARGVAPSGGVARITV